MPFRSINFLPPASSQDQVGYLLEHTLLRLLPGDGAGGRLLFELGTAAEHSNGDVDYYTRNRLLAKIWNNVTVRSNVFYCFITIRAFEAVEVTPDPNQPDVTAVRIGGPLKDANGDYVVNQRGFFVIDRSDIEEAYDPTTGRFNWRALVKYRLRLE
ncbi:MAG: hypothetical protein GXP27_22540 [Planctomycetes bacterium]|nr:hypothetical protein [Planctomycetota bacterium]